MNKLAVFASAVTLALAGSSIAAANGMGPGGFGHHNLRGGPGGFGAPNLPVVTVAQLQQAYYDDARVAMQGKLTNYYGHDRYEFTDKTGSILVELDDDRNWFHINRDQLIMIYGKVDYDDGRIEVEVKRAHPVN